MRFSPIKASKEIYNKYRLYLDTLFSINDPDYNLLLKKVIDEEAKFAKGPYIDLDDIFVKGKSISDYIYEGVFPTTFNRLNINRDRKFYMHQQEAIDAIINGDNVVVSTGTGSGKTESFLLPILRKLVIQNENNKLSSGVRALIIYPMNALANDQVGRLRLILKDFPEITFGSYTGQTKEKYSEALEEYLILNERQKPISNELISREQMKTNPPNILITNYAMLEYLMLRPDDSIFFVPQYTKDWQYIVLDEAHVYKGSTGIEVSMLLRRLKTKINSKNLQFILTSATLGNEKSNDEVAEFASNLCCDSLFLKDNIIRAKREQNMVEPLYTLPDNFYTSIASQLNIANDDNDVINYIKTNFKTLMSIHNINFDKYALNILLYDLILRDKLYNQVRNIVTKPYLIEKLATELKIKNEEIEDFIFVATKAEKDGAKLFDIRYHMFIKANDSVFITLAPNKRVFLKRLKYYTENNIKYKAFEIATCGSCDQIYIVGQQKDGILEQNSSSTYDEVREVYLLANNINDTDDEFTFNDAKIIPAPMKLCPFCGSLIANNVNSNCEHDKALFHQVYKITVKNDDGVLRKCLTCENKNNYGVLKMFFGGHEAVTSVIGTALYESLPSYRIKKVISEKPKYFSNTPIIPEINRESIYKQYLAFSDNRQAAAYFSTYFQETYQKILYKRMIVEILKKEKYKEKKVNFNLFVDELNYLFNNCDIFNTNDKESMKAGLYELVSHQSDLSLFGQGLIGFSLEEGRITGLDYFGLTKEETLNIFNVMISGMLSENAIEMPEFLNKTDKSFFSFNGLEYRYTYSASDTTKYIKSFIPSNKSKKNKRLDYVERLFREIKPDFTEHIGFLEELWMQLIAHGYLNSLKDTYKLNLGKIQIYSPQKLYKCKKCKKITPFNVRNICPTYKCDGILEEYDNSNFENNHYNRLYNELEIIDLNIKEHTAQLDRERAYEYQKKFVDKKINILSCSTTFEMGVDVGSLETVFMRNMPPSPANYAQRAGRAGRTKNAAAYALTFCNRGSHDFTYFENPELMIKGNIKPPKFNIINPKIAIRHVFASAFDFFWKKNQENFGQAKSMFSTDDDCSGFKKFIAYLNSKPTDLEGYLIGFLPQGLSKKLKIKNFEWLDLLIGDNGNLDKAYMEYMYEISILNEAKKIAFSKNQRIDYLTNRIKTLESENIISFLSKKNVIPKYGFPVDTVELKVHNLDIGNIELQRDLSVALSEYAPGSEVIADGKLITSRYIKRVPKKEWPAYEYSICSCGTLNIEPYVQNYSNLTICKACKKSIDSKKGVFIIPIFGFEADVSTIKKPGLRKPKKTYTSSIFYVGYNAELKLTKHKIGRGEIELKTSNNDKLAILNQSSFFVCPSCGYSIVDNKEHKTFISKKHVTNDGRDCVNNLFKYNLGYTFETDVLQIIFVGQNIENINLARSLLYSIIKAISFYLDIEENEISGCLGYYNSGYSLVIFDSNPGGAGHVRRVNSDEIISNVLYRALKFMEDCDCGVDNADSSCYTCLRTYSNQRYHDILSRKLVIDFLKRII